MSSVGAIEFKTKYWWKLPENERYRGIVAAIKSIDKNNIFQRTRNWRNLRMYGNFSPTINGMSGSIGSQSYEDVRNIPINVIKSVVDAAVSQIAPNYSKIMNLTNGASEMSRQRTENLNKFIEGLIFETNADESFKFSNLLSCIGGTNHLKIIEKDNKVALEKILFDDLLIDIMDGIYGSPKQIFQIKQVSRESLLSDPKFYQFEEQITMAGNTIRDTENYMFAHDRTITDVISIAEAFHLNSGDDVNDGLHVICLDNCDLFVEEWKKDYFPYAKMDWIKSPIGYWGYGIADQLIGIQSELDYLHEKIREGISLQTCQLWSPIGNQVNENDFQSGRTGHLNNYAISAPTLLNIQPVPPELFAREDWLIRQAYEITGVSQMMAMGKKIPGLDTGKAQLVHKDIASERLLCTSQNYDKFVMDCVDMMLDKVLEIYEREGSYSVRVKGKHSFDVLDWKKIKEDREKFISQPYPVSFLSQTPEVKYEQIAEMYRDGMLSKNSASYLLASMDPDLESATRIENATHEYAVKTIENIISTGNIPQIEPSTPLQEIFRLLPLEILYSEMDGDSEDKINPLREYLANIASAIKNLNINTSQSNVQNNIQQPKINQEVPQTIQQGNNQQ